MVSKTREENPRIPIQVNIGVLWWSLREGGKVNTPRDSINFSKQSFPGKIQALLYTFGHGKSAGFSSWLKADTLYCIYSGTIVFKKKGPFSNDCTNKIWYSHFYIKSFLLRWCNYRHFKNYLQLTGPENRLFFCLFLFCYIHLIQSLNPTP